MLWLQRSSYLHVAIEVLGKRGETHDRPDQENKRPDEIGANACLGVLCNAIVRMYDGPGWMVYVPDVRNIQRQNQPPEYFSDTQPDSSGPSSISGHVGEETDAPRGAGEQTKLKQLGKDDEIRGQGPSWHLPHDAFMRSVYDRLADLPRDRWDFGHDTARPQPFGADCGPVQCAAHVMWIAAIWRTEEALSHGIVSAHASRRTGLEALLQFLSQVDRTRKKKEEGKGRHVETEQSSDMKDSDGDGMDICKPLKVAFGTRPWGFAKPRQSASFVDSILVIC
ncbi:hypothetical protein QBC37DRAFT_395536 [Rhypophila decipiens]|uniref:Uncharacterized protein n=1 Tax=Rhypophila decipiens TaxID=261697 RepID=A0AAN6YLR9_9PEZI|nr:hypothetical protein QBC37DRAFT_395536 [Rhypophila decipiens]